VEALKLHIMAVAIGIITGVLTGIISAVLFWWWQAKLMRPKLILCPTIARYRLPGEKVDRYQIKIINGRRRLAVDLKVTVAIHLPGLVRHGSVETLTLLKSENPSLGINVRYRIQPGRMPQDTKDRYLSYFPAYLAKSISHGQTVDLDEFFKIYEGAFLRVSASATDSFSGANGFVRETYYADSMRAGRFAGGRSCEHSGLLEEPEDRDDGG
jgi:hypothetical protein